MAKGNLFLGTAARSVGDVVMYRREGAQVSRVRVRKIANPKTDAQCLQRAFMSACVKFYQPLANVLDRSWQGKSRAKSYAAFLKANAPKVRAAGYFIPKGSGFIGLPLEVSKGTLAPVAIEGNSALLFTWLLNLTTEEQSATITTVGQLSNILLHNGFKAGDVITVIESDGVGDGGDATKQLPVAHQFLVDDEDDTTLAAALPGWRIAVAQAGRGLEFTSNLPACYAVGIINSRNVDGVWQRSNCTMLCGASYLEEFTSDAAKTACIDSYKGAAASDNPLVYLDGDELTD